ncbi:hypothetical protein [Flagellimonas sp. CMM7]|uniref:hypothetical protein n=1 Tax=Flagellimonas sp. CMM7 TaxID=2654676 RepID=UPI0013D6544F|nr:hypothetical protein [Flagellimonas sp. CMM7]UII79544.1 hypothetical protein LV704_18025 [Flagellimonas sp. CMM7]
MVSNNSQITYILIILFIFVSCSKDSSDGGAPGTVRITSISNGDIIAEPTKFTANIEGGSIQGSTIEVFLNESIIHTVENKGSISLDFDPEAYDTGSHVLKITLTGKNGKTETSELNFEVHRKLVTINLPENMVNQYIVNAVVFASKMNGSLLSAQRFTNDDRVLVVTSPQEFDIDEEFMLSFALTDNGSATSMSTHANLTRTNPGTINLSQPHRGEDVDTKTYPIIGFESNDRISSSNVHRPSKSAYRLDLDANEGTFTVHLIEDPNFDVDAPEIFYMYGSGDAGNYQHLTLFHPLSSDFVLDKADFVTDGLEQHSISLNSSNGFKNNSFFMNVYGYWKEKDFENNNFHLIDSRSQSVNLGDQVNYTLNTNFYDYRYWMTFSNYYAAGSGAPKDSFTIPENTLDFTYADNLVNFEVTGTDHIIGRIRLHDGGTYPIYVWDITFDSKTISSFPLPQLPPEMNESNLLLRYENNLLKVLSTELVSYQGIASYGEYIQKVIKNHYDPIQVSGGQELIYKSTTPFHEGPIEDFPFQ